MLLPTTKPTLDYTSNGRTFVLSPKDPYGFWHVYEGDKELDMKFTSSEEAKLGVDNLTHNIPNEVF